MTTRFDAMIAAAASRRGLDPDLVTAVVEQESDGRWYDRRFEPGFYARYLHGKAEWLGRDAQEVASSYGLMQVMFTTAVELGFVGEPWDLFRPDVNLALGCALLEKLFTQQRRLASATSEDVILRAVLASYNGGMKGNEADDAPDRNHAYADAVLARLARIKGAH